MRFSIPQLGYLGYRKASIAGQGDKALLSSSKFLEISPIWVCFDAVACKNFSLNVLREYAASTK